MVEVLERPEVVVPVLPAQPLVIENPQDVEVFPPRVLHVSVTEYHIRVGIPGDSNLCAIAMALLMVDDQFRWEVGGGIIGMANGKGTEYNYQLPDTAAAFIEQFDRRRPDDDDRDDLSPFTFDATLMNGYDERGFFVWNADEGFKQYHEAPYEDEDNG